MHAFYWRENLSLSQSIICIPFSFHVYFGDAATLTEINDLEQIIDFCMDVLYSHATHFHILSHIWPSVPRFEHVGFHVILNAGTRRHGHQLKQSVKLGRALDLSVTQCTIAQT